MVSCNDDSPNWLPGTSQVINPSPPNGILANSPMTAVNTNDVGGSELSLFFFDTHMQLVYMRSTISGASNGAWTYTTTNSYFPGPLPYNMTSVAWEEPTPAGSTQPYSKTPSPTSRALRTDTLSFSSSRPCICHPLHGCRWKCIPMDQCTSRGRNLEKAYQRAGPSRCLRRLRCHKSRGW